MFWYLLLSGLGVRLCLIQWKVYLNVCISLPKTSCNQALQRECLEEKLGVNARRKKCRQLDLVSEPPAELRIILHYHRARRKQRQTFTVFGCCLSTKKTASRPPPYRQNVAAFHLYIRRLIRDADGFPFAVNASEEEKQPQLIFLQVAQTLTQNTDANPARNNRTPLRDAMPAINKLHTCIFPMLFMNVHCKKKKEKPAASGSVRFYKQAGKICRMNEITPAK